MLAANLYQEKLPETAWGLGRDGIVESVLSTPYDWSIIIGNYCDSLLQCLHQSFGFAHAKSNKHVEHVNTSCTAPFDVLTFDILTWID